MDPQNLPQPPVQTVQPVQQNEHITSSKRSFPWKKIIPLLLVFVIFLIGAGYYYQTQKKSKEKLPPAPTIPTKAVWKPDNWKVYKNATLKYYIKYPNEWTINEASDGAVVIFAPGAELEPETQKNTPGAGITPTISIEVLSKPFTQKDSAMQSATNLVTVAVDGVVGNYYTTVSAPATFINLDMPFYNRKTIRFSFPKNFENFETFNPKHLPNVAKFDEETFKIILSTFSYAVSLVSQ